MVEQQQERQNSANDRLPFRLSEDEIGRLPRRDAIHVSLSWAKTEMPYIDWAVLDRNKVSFALQKWMEQEHHTVGDIRDAIGVVRPLDWCESNGVRPLYVPWDSEAQRQELEALVAVDKRANLSRRIERLGPRGDKLDLGEHLWDAITVFRSDLVLKFIKEDGYLYTIGNHYFTGGTELFFLFDPMTTDPSSLANCINVWATQPANETTVEAVVGKTIAEIFGGESAAGDQDAPFATADSRFRLMLPADKVSMMGYSIWFYVNFADTHIDEVPYCVIDLREAGASTA